MKKFLLILFLFASIPLEAQYVRQYVSGSVASGGCANYTEWINTGAAHTFSWCDNGTWRTIQAIANPIGVTSGGTGTATQFTLGSVIFAGTSGVYSQDNSKFFYNSTTHRLGLGTVSPNTVLDIFPTAASGIVEGIRITNNSAGVGDGGAIRFDTAAGSIGRISSYATGANQGYLNIDFSTGAGIFTTGVTFFNGGEGIGKVPVTPLDVVGAIQGTTTITGASFKTATNCSNAASPAVCGSASAGTVAIPTGVTSVALTINTTAVTANSRIFLVSDDSTTIAATTCNSTLATLAGALVVTGRVASTSFTVTYNGTIATNPLCINWFLVN